MNKTDLALIDARIELELERLTKLLTLRHQLNKHIKTTSQTPYQYNSEEASALLVQQSDTLHATI
ncbi:MAG TPA: hypothetical protein EYQ12_04950 [Oceanospirillaceae bacterium]|jgi:hypothetical protein|nr:hypothetical protein [Oceanospirillaceae bacterium]